MSYWGWPCGCPQCTDDGPEEYDPFEEWALDEVERQFDVAASHDAEPELACIPPGYNPAQADDGQDA